MDGLAGLLGGSIGGVTAEGGGCWVELAAIVLIMTGASLVGVGGGETGDGNEEEAAGQGVDAFEEPLRLP